MTAAPDHPGQLELLAAYPDQVSDAALGRARVFPLSSRDHRLIGEFVRFDDTQAASRQAVVIVCISDRYYLVNGGGVQEFAYDRNAGESPSTAEDAGRVTDLLPAQDVRFLDQVADIELPGGRHVHGRYVRADDSGRRTVVIMTTGPDRHFYLGTEVLHGLCTGGDCPLTDQPEPDGTTP